MVVATTYENDDTFYDYRPYEFAIWEVFMHFTLQDLRTCSNLS
jgi:hypothetical protein